MSLRNSTVWSAIVLLTLGAGGAASGQPAADGKKTIRTNPNGTMTIDDPAMGFKVVLPKGSQEFPKGVGGTIVYFVVVGTPPDSYNVAIEKMGGKIGKQMPSAAQLPASVKVIPAEWRGFKVFAARMEQKTEAGHFVDFAAQIPIKREAIQLHVTGPIADEEKLKKALADLLGVLSGDTNWK